MTDINVQNVNVKDKFTDDAVVMKITFKEHYVDSTR